MASNSREDRWNWHLSSELTISSDLLCYCFPCAGSVSQVAGHKACCGACGAYNWHICSHRKDFKSMRRQCLYGKHYHQVFYCNVLSLRFKMITILIIVTRILNLMTDNDDEARQQFLLPADACIPAYPAIPPIILETKTTNQISRYSTNNPRNKNHQPNIPLFHQ